MNDAPGTVTRTFHQGAVLVRRLMEFIVLLLVCFSPWAFGAVHPLPELILYAGVALLLALWGARALLEWSFAWKNCPVALCLAGLFLLGVSQLVPWPASFLQTISPATRRLCDQFLPSAPEVLPGGQAKDAAALPAGSSLSLYPGATRGEVVRLLAVFLLFAIVRNNIASAAALRRLSIAAVFNGALLSLLGLTQYFSAPAKTLYWIYPCQGQVFGPFICRNHFPFYVNMCLGLGIGLLFSLKASGAAGTGRHSRATFGRFEGDFLAAVARYPIAGGAAAPTPGLVGGHGPRADGVQRDPLPVAGRPALLARRPAGRLLDPALPLAPEALLGTGSGGGVHHAGIGNLARGRADAGAAGARLDPENLEADRLSLWSRALPIAKEFPLWGTGLGTFPVVEPLHRTSERDAFLYYDHAHNDYLQALVEGGIVRLVLSLVTIGLVFRFGYRAFRHAPDGLTVRWHWED